MEKRRPLRPPQSVKNAKPPPPGRSGPSATESFFDLLARLIARRHLLAQNPWIRRPCVPEKPRQAVHLSALMRTERKGKWIWKIPGR